MAASKRVAAINLGMQTVTVAVFETTANSGLLLSGVAQSGLLPDPSADSSRSGQLKIALTELRAKLKIGNTPCAVVIPSQGVFSRFVKIPKVETEQVGQMLFFEAQQNVPYPIEEVSWCYQVLPESEQDKFGAVILATKLDQIETTVEAVCSSGFSPSLIESSPTALYNALRFNYPDLTGCTLLIDIGARATNLIFAENERLFIRTLPVGGNSITGALQKSFSDKPLSLLEELKVKEAYIAPPGNYDSQGSDAGEMAKIARTVMTRVHNEITRSITFYRTNQQGSAPTRAFLSGGGASLPYTLEFFNEKLSLPVEFFNPLRRVSIAPSADAELVRASTHKLGECVGIAARQLIGDCPIEVAFESPRLREAARDKLRRPFLIAATFLVASTLAALFFHYKSGADHAAEANAALESRVAGLQNFKTQMDAASAQRTRLLEEAADLAMAPLLRTAWASILAELTGNMPARNIWITSLRPALGETVLDTSKRDGSWGVKKSGDDEEKPMITAIAVDGLYLENEKGPAVVDAYLESLAQSPVFAIDPARKADVVKLRAAQSGEAWAYDFKLLIPLRRPIPL